MVQFYEYFELFRLTLGVVKEENFEFLACLVYFVLLYSSDTSSMKHQASFLSSSTFDSQLPDVPIICFWKHKILYNFFIVRSVAMLLEWVG